MPKWFKWRLICFHRLVPSTLCPSSIHPPSVPVPLTKTALPVVLLWVFHGNLCSQHPYILFSQKRLTPALGEAHPSLFSNSLPASGSSSRYSSEDWVQQTGGLSIGTPGEYVPDSESNSEDTMVCDYLIHFLRESNSGRRTWMMSLLQFSRVQEDLYYYLFKRRFLARLIHTTPSQHIASRPRIYHHRSPTPTHRNNSRIMFRVPFDLVFPQSTSHHPPPRQ